MKLIRTMTTPAFFALPILWNQIFGNSDTSLENIWLKVGSVLAWLFFWVREGRDNKKRLNGEMVLISFQESVQLGFEIEGFIKQPMGIMNATGNLEGLCLYKVTEKMRSKLQVL